MFKWVFWFGLWLFCSEATCKNGTCNSQGIGHCMSGNLLHSTRDICEDAGYTWTTCECNNDVNNGFSKHDNSIGAVTM